MKLRLTLVRCPPAQGNDVARDLGTGRLTVGRGPDNDWVLADPERLLSKNHCMVEFKGGVYVVIDCSTNGVFVNDATDPIGRGNSAVIGEGDRLRLGGFVIRAGFAAAEAAPANDPFLAVLRATEAPADDFLDRRPVPSDDPFAVPAAERRALPVMPIPEDDDGENAAPFGGRPPRNAAPWAGEGWQATAASGEAPAWRSAGSLDQASDDLGAMRVAAPVAPAIPDDWLDDDPFTAVSASPAPLPVAAPVPAGLPDDWDDEPLVPPAFAGRPAVPDPASSSPGPSPTPSPRPPGGAFPAEPSEGFQAPQLALTRALVEALLTIDRRQVALEALLGLDPDDTLDHGDGLLRRAADPDDAMARLLALPDAEAADRLRAVVVEGAAHQSALLAAMRELIGETADGGARLAALYRRLLPVHRQALGV